MTPNYINHIVLVLDASSSMTNHAKKLIEVADSHVAYLAQRSKDLDQETRITVYSFSDRNSARCLVYDKDVLRMPSIANLYKTNGMTALVDATILAIEDLHLTPQKYGEHAFLIYVLTDGQENDSHARPDVLKNKIAALPNHWTLAAFVPNQHGIFEAKKFGFPPNNIAIWDTTSVAGMVEVGNTIKKSTEQFMVNRTKGIRGTTNLFQLNVLSPDVIEASLPSIPPSEFRMIPVRQEGRIDDTVLNELGIPYAVGKAFYQLTKTETIQPQKEIALLANGRVHVGSNARKLLGLPDDHVKVKPGDHPGYTIFVQSTSVNRKLLAGTNLLVFK